MGESLNRRRREELAHGLSTNAPWLEAEWSQDVVALLGAEPELQVPAGTVQAATMLLSELGRVYDVEPLGMLADRTGPDRAAARHARRPDPPTEPELDKAHDISEAGRQ